MLECCSQPHLLEKRGRAFGSECGEKGVVRAKTPVYLPASAQLRKRIEQVAGDHCLQLKKAALAVVDKRWNLRLRRVRSGSTIGQGIGSCRNFARGLQTSAVCSRRVGVLRENRQLRYYRDATASLTASMSRQRCPNGAGESCCDVPERDELENCD